MAPGYPITLKLKGRTCLVVGGGAVAERKVLTLLRHEAAIKVVSPGLTPKLKELSLNNDISYRPGKYKEEDLQGVFLVISATSDNAVNNMVAAQCQRLNILVNVAEEPSRGNFYVPAVLRRGDLQIAISTDGKSPLLARRLKEELEQTYGPGYGRMAELLGQIRGEVMGTIEDPQQRKLILANLVDNEVLYLLRAGQFDQAKERVINAFNNSRGKS